MNCGPRRARLSLSAAFFGVARAGAPFSPRGVGDELSETFDAVARKVNYAGLTWLDKGRDRRRGGENSPPGSGRKGIAGAALYLLNAGDPADIS